MLPHNFEVKLSHRNCLLYGDSLGYIFGNTCCICFLKGEYDKVYVIDISITDQNNSLRQLTHNNRDSEAVS